LCARPASEAPSVVPAGCAAGVRRLLEGVAHAGGTSRPPKPSEMPILRVASTSALAVIIVCDPFR